MNEWSKYIDNYFTYSKEIEEISLMQKLCNIERYQPITHNIEKD
jgi:hypothetical protein